MDDIDLDALRRLPRRAKQTWQGSYAQIPAWVHENGEHFRPWGAAWIDLTTGRISVGRVERRAEDPGARSRTLIEVFAGAAAGREGGRPGLPRRVELSAADLAPDVRAFFDALGIEQAEIPKAWAIEKVLACMVGKEPEDAFPPLRDVAGATPELLRDFAEAAQAFARAEPWRRLTSEDVVLVESPRAPKALRCCFVLGARRDCFGLAFADSPTRAARIVGEMNDPLGRGAAEDTVLADGGVDVTFRAKWELPFADADLFDELDLPVAAPDRYPLLAQWGPGQRPRRPSATTIAFAAAMMRALAASTEADLDAERWSRQVALRGRETTFTLSLCELRGPDGAPLRATDRRAMERALAEIRRFVVAGSFKTVEEEERAVRERFAGPLDDIPSTASRPLDRAQDLAYRAFDSLGRRRVKLAREALALSPDCADAFVILAESAFEPEEALRRYEEGVAAGERALGPERFAAPADPPFWGDISTRGFLRALLGAGRTLLTLGRFEEGARHLTRLVALDQGDHLGARFRLAPLLLELGRDDDAEKLLVRFAGERSAWLAFARALVLFRREGDGPKSRMARNRALKADPVGVELLRCPLETLDGLGAPLSDDERAIAMQRRAWETTPGAFDWLGRK